MSKATCSDSGCGKQSFARGLCQRHYNIAYRAGTLPPKQPIPGVHSLTNIDRDARTADCSICGSQASIRIRDRKGSSGFECLTKIGGNRHRWKRGRGKPSRESAARQRRHRKYKKYKITQDDYDRMFADQRGCCAICRSPHPVLSIDHDHETGTVRGLLCHGCNVALGFLRDDVGRLRSAIQYLTIHRSSAA